MWKGFFYYSKSDKRVIIMLSVVIVLAVSAFFLIGRKSVSPVSVISVDTTSRDSFYRKYPSRSGAPCRSYDISIREDGGRVELFSFDPNIADSIALFRLGLLHWQIDNLMKYRRRGGVWRSREQFSRLYGLSPEKYRQLHPYIVIGSQFQRAKRDSMLRDTVWQSRYPQKYAEPTRVDVNLADTSALVKIPGVGSGRARQIVAYRERLGGFCRVSQVLEIEGMPADVVDWLVVGVTVIRRMKVNELSLQKLRLHPYINFYQARVIVEHRRKFGKLRGVNDLRNYDEFSSDDLKRLENYLEF